MCCASTGSPTRRFITPMGATGSSLGQWNTSLSTHGPEALLYLPIELYPLGHCDGELLPSLSAASPRGGLLEGDIPMSRLPLDGGGEIVIGVLLLGTRLPRQERSRDHRRGFHRHTLATGPFLAPLLELRPDFGECFSVHGTYYIP